MPWRKDGLLDVCHESKMGNWKYSLEVRWEIGCILRGKMGNLMNALDVRGLIECMLWR